MPSPLHLAPSRPTLYLDYDGVLHPDEVYRRKDGSIFVKNVPNMEASLFMWAEPLGQCLEGRDLQIVLATSWVKVLGFKRASSYLPESLSSKIVGSTYHSSQRQDWDQYSRYQQIQKHATRHSVLNWLALDNDIELWSDLALANLCACDDVTGISKEWYVLNNWLDLHAPKLATYTPSESLCL